MYCNPYTECIAKKSVQRNFVSDGAAGKFWTKSENSFFWKLLKAKLTKCKQKKVKSGKKAEYVLYFCNEAKLCFDFRWLAFLLDFSWFCFNLLSFAYSFRKLIFCFFGPPTAMIWPGSVLYRTGFLNKVGLDQTWSFLAKSKDFNSGDACALRGGWRNLTLTRHWSALLGKNSRVSCAYQWAAILKRLNFNIPPPVPPLSPLPLQLQLCLNRSEWLQVQGGGSLEQDTIL